MNTQKTLKIRQCMYIILIVLWMATVFGFSNQPAEKSDETSLAIANQITEIVSKVKPVNDDINQLLNKVVRKLAHYTIYLVGGILIINYINTLKLKDKQKIIYAILIGLIYAATDEFHQNFIEGRSPLLIDVFIDTIGVITGVCVYYFMQRIANKQKNVLQIEAGKQESKLYIK